MTSSTDSTSSVAFIPARGGSKRVPRKNLVDFHGRPLIAWAIEAAIESGAFSYVVVSTDDEEIADVARCEGAEVPFLRPAELSGDHVATAPVVEHALADFRERTGVMPTVIGVVYPAAVFTTGVDLARSVRLLSDLGVDMVMSAGRSINHVEKVAGPRRSVLRCGPVLRKHSRGLGCNRVGSGSTHCDVRDGAVASLGYRHTSGSRDGSTTVQHRPSRVGAGRNTLRT